MEKQIFIVTTVIYDHYDNNLWSDAKAFSDEGTAREYFKQEGRKCLAEAQGQDEFDSPDDYYPVERTESAGKLEYYKKSDEPEHYEVKITRCVVDI